MEKYSLKTIRDLRGFSQKEAADKLGISKDTLRAYEKGKRFPDIKMLKKIELLYDITYNQLVFLPRNDAFSVEN